MHCMNEVCFLLGKIYTEMSKRGIISEFRVNHEEAETSCLSCTASKEE